VASMLLVSWQKFKLRRKSAASVGAPQPAGQNV